MSEVVGLLLFPLGESLRDRSRGALGRAYRRALFERANPRDRAYMERLFAERHPDGRIVGDATEAEGHIVLLYPDAIGLGWSAIERRLHGRDLQVLNGRGREFHLDRPTHRALRLRRILERTMLGEAAFLCALAVATPALLAFDLARGRR